MTKAKSKRKPTSRTNDSKTKTRNGVRRTTARKAATQASTTQAHYKAGGSSAAAVRVAADCTSRKQKNYIIAMLRAPDGATIEAMARAAKWQPHSVRGFLAGVVRKLGLNLVSADAENGRVYRITDRSTSAAT